MGKCTSHHLFSYGGLSKLPIAVLIDDKAVSVKLRKQKSFHFQSINTANYRGVNSMKRHADNSGNRADL